MLTNSDAVEEFSYEDPNAPGKGKMGGSSCDTNDTFKEELCSLVEQKTSLELTNYELKQKLIKFRQFEEEFAELKLNKEELIEQNKNLQIELNQLKERNNQICKENIELMNLNNLYKNSIHSTEKERITYKSRKEMLTNTIKSLEKELNILKKKNLSLNNNIINLKDQLDNEYEEKIELEKEKQDIITLFENKLAQAELEKKQIFKENFMNQLFSMIDKETILKFVYDEETNMIDVYIDNKKVIEVPVFHKEKKMNNNDSLVHIESEMQNNEPMCFTAKKINKENFVSVSLNKLFSNNSAKSNLNNVSNHEDVDLFKIWDNKFLNEIDLTEKINKVERLIKETTLEVKREENKHVNLEIVSNIQHMIINEQNKNKDNNTVCNENKFSLIKEKDAQRQVNCINIENHFSLINEKVVQIQQNSIISQNNFSFVNERTDNKQQNVINNQNEFSLINEIIHSKQQNTLNFQNDISFINEKIIQIQQRAINIQSQNDFSLINKRNIKVDLNIEKACSFKFSANIRKKELYSGNIYYSPSSKINNQTDPIKHYEDELLSKSKNTIKLNNKREEKDTRSSCGSCTVF